MKHAELSVQARQLLRSLELPDEPLEPVESYSHAVWLAGEYVVRMHVIGPVGRLEHEARVAACLPPEALYPQVVAVGRVGQDDWMLTRRVPGDTLSAVWSYLSRDERRAAIHQAAAALRAIHMSYGCNLVPPCLQGGARVVTRQKLVERLRARGVESRFGWLLNAGDFPQVMAHGDFSFNQIMWHEGRMMGLLDVEMAHAEASDWDLATFLAFCENPVRMVPERLEAVTRPEDYRDAPLWLREAYPQMFNYPQMRARLALHALVLHSEMLQDEENIREEVFAAAVEWADRMMLVLENK